MTESDRILCELYPTRKDLLRSVRIATPHPNHAVRVPPVIWASMGLHNRLSFRWHGVRVLMDPRVPGMDVYPPMPGTDEAMEDDRTMSAAQCREVFESWYEQALNEAGVSLLDDEVEL